MIYPRSLVLQPLLVALVRHLGRQRQERHELRDVHLGHEAGRQDGQPAQHAGGLEPLPKEDGRGGGGEEGLRAVCIVKVVW